MRFLRFIPRLFRYFIGHSQVGVVFLLGLALSIWGGWIWQQHPRVSTVLISIGTSLIAAALVTFLSPQNQEVYQKFLRLGIIDIYPCRDEVPPRDWVRWLGRAKRQCALLGVAHGGWRRDPEFFDTLADRLRRGVEVKIFFLNPLGTLAEVREHEEERETRRETRTSIAALWKFRLELPPGLQQRLHLYVYDNTPSSGTTWIDDQMLITHYLAGFANLTSPALLVKPVGGESPMDDLYSVYAENVRHVESKPSTIEITEENVAKYSNTD